MKLYLLLCIVLLYSCCENQNEESDISKRNFDSYKITILDDSLSSCELLNAYHEPCNSQLNQYAYYFRIIYDRPFDTSFIISIRIDNNTKSHLYIKSIPPIFNRQIGTYLYQYNNPVKFLTVYFLLSEDEITAFKKLIADLNFWKKNISEFDYIDFDDTAIKLLGYENEKIKEIRYFSSQNDQKFDTFIDSIKVKYLSRLRRDE